MNMENMKPKEQEFCLCGVSEYVVMTCSGACDLGEIADAVARKLRDNGVRKMSCLALIGAGSKKSIEALKTKNILVIDGCPTDCGKRILDNAGITSYKSFRVTDAGLKKGQTPVTADVITAVYEKVETIY